LDRASDYGSEGWGFEFLQVHEQIQRFKIKTKASKIKARFYFCTAFGLEIAKQFALRSNELKSFICSSDLKDPPLKAAIPPECTVQFA
jgi:hypothetical protein